jgi:alpha-glucosidase
MKQTKFPNPSTRRFAAMLSIAANVVILLAMQTSAVAQLGAVTAVARDGDRLNLTVGSDLISVDVREPDMLEVHYQPHGRSSAQTASLAVTTWAPVRADFRIESDPIVISTSRMTVRISRAPCRIAVYDASDRLLVKEPDAEGVYPGGLNLTGASGSRYFGIHGWQFLDQAGSRQELAPSATPYNIDAGCEGNTGGPFLWSNTGFGVYVDTDGGQCQIGDSAGATFSGLSRPDVEYDVMVGNAYRVHNLLDRLTGMPPMFPKWALGLFNSEFCGITEPTFRSIIDGYRSRGIPFDTYVFDFDWKDWSGDNYGEWNWNPVKFPSGPSGQLKKDMDAKGIKLVGIMKPRIHVDTVQGRYATRAGFWVKRPFYKDYYDGGRVGDLDFSIPACRQWFWDHSTNAFDRGIIGWWNDEADAWGDNYEFMYMAQAEYEGQRRYTHDRQRVYTINRNFYSGSQRYAYATWSGDIDSGFAVMRDQRARLLASLNVGQAKWAMDTDGFNNNNHVEGLDASECYARWMEFDAFVPIFRLHGTSRRQPWLYGPVAEAAATKAIKLRYSLIPYLYAYDRTLNQTGIGICRPLIWDYPNDPNCVNDVDSWMFGDYLLVSPVVDQHQSVKSIYLPAGTWIDYFRGTVYTGPQTISYSVDPSTWDDIPLFIKSGAIVPTIEVMNYIGERPVTTVTIDVYPSAAKTGFTYYDDDGITYDYEKGSYFSQTMTSQAKAGRVEFAITPRRGTYAPQLRNYLCDIHCGAGLRVVVNGKALKRYPNTDALKATSQEGWATGTGIHGDSTWVMVPAGDARTIEIETGGGKALRDRPSSDLARYLGRPGQRTGMGESTISDSVQ